MFHTRSQVMFLNSKVDGSLHGAKTSTIHGPELPDLYYKNNIGQRITLQSLYMAWGGTNWVSTNDISTWPLANSDTKTGFYILQHNTSSSRTNETLSADLDTTAGIITVPNVTIDGRQSKIAVTDYGFGNHTLLYSTTEALTYGIFDVDVIVLYIRAGHVGQFAFRGVPTDLTYNVSGNFNFTSTTANGTTKFVYTQAEGVSAIKFSDGTVVHLLDLWTAWQFWAPATTRNPSVSPNQQIFVLGPYLIRDACVSGEELHVSGDSNITSTIDIYTGKSINVVFWNGIKLQASTTPWGSVTDPQIPGTEDRNISLPLLTDWKSADSLPEIDRKYDDSKWQICDKVVTSSPIPPITLPILFSSDYGFYVGPKIYRGYFDGVNATSVNLTASGGLAFGFNAWLNGQLIGGHPGDPELTNLNTVLLFENVALSAIDNVQVVLVDYHGHDQTSTAAGVENPRGILGAALDNGVFRDWKIQGNAGGSMNIDPVRGPRNEGGLYGERMGWHLPGYGVSNWKSKLAPTDGIAKSGVQFYITIFDLDVDSDLEAPLGIEFSAPTDTVARLMFWVNAYQSGKAVFHIGPQLRFPVPPGVINNRGSNTLAASLWAQTDQGANRPGRQVG